MKGFANDKNRNDGIYASEGIAYSFGVYKGDGVQGSRGVDKSSGINMGKGVSCSSGISYSEGVSCSSGISYSEGVSCSSGAIGCNDICLSKGVYSSVYINSANGVANCRGVSKSGGVSNSDGVYRSKGVNDSYGIALCEGISKSIFCYNTSGEHLVFNKKVVGARYEEIYITIQEFNWWPNFNNSKHIKGDLRWYDANIPAIAEVPLRIAWSDMPQKMKNYLQSLPEYDEEIFNKVTGIMEETDIAEH